MWESDYKLYVKCLIWYIENMQKYKHTKFCSITFAWKGLSILQESKILNSDTASTNLNFKHQAAAWGKMLQKEGGQDAQS